MPIVVAADAAKSDTIRSLILVDESGNQALDLLEQLTGKTILRQQNLPIVRININIQNPIPRDEAINAIESSLSMNGIAVVEMGNEFLKAVPATESGTQSPTLITGSTLVMEPSQKIFSKIYDLKFLNAKEVSEQFSKNFVTPKTGSLFLVDKKNALVVTDSLVNLQRLETMLNRLDKPLALQEELLSIALKNISAEDLKARLEAMQKGGLNRYLAGTTFEANANQLLVFTHPGNVPLIQNLVSSMDVNVAPLHTTKTFRLKHADSMEVADLLKALIKGIPTPKKEGGRDERAALLERLRAVAGKSSESKGEEKSQEFSQTLTLEGEKRSNAIVAFGTPRDIELVGKLIDEIDVRLPQVRIEVIIAEVTLGNDYVNGLSAFGLRYQTQVPNAEPNGNFNEPFRPNPYRGSQILENLMTLTTTNITGFPFNIAGSLSKFSMNDVFQVSQLDSNVKILSAPMILTTHNQKAIVKVVTDQPYVNNAIGDTGSTTPTTLRTSVDYLKDIGIVLEVTPLIGPNDVIQMKITQTVKALGNAVQLSDGLSARQITNREADSFISVMDQQVIVLAGLQQNQITRRKGKIWLFGYLPIVGDMLFSPKSDEETRTELVMFIRPHIVRDTEDVVQVYGEAIENTSACKEVNRFVEYGHFSEPRPNMATEPRGRRNNLFTIWD